MTKANLESTASPKKTTVKTSTVKKAPASRKKVDHSSESGTHFKMVQDAAYFLAEQNNFSGDPMTFWLEAEAQVRGKASK